MRDIGREGYSEGFSDIVRDIGREEYIDIVRDIEKEVGKGWGLHCSLYGTAHHCVGIGIVCHLSLPIYISLSCRQCH